MRGSSLALVIIISFVLGCVAAPLIVPPVRADQKNVQKWEYTCQSVFFRGGANAEAKAMTQAFNKFGAEGWELVGSGGISSGGEVSCFKRPL